MTTAIKSISLSLELLQWVEKYKISLSEAVRVGISVMLCDLGETQFLNNLNLGRKVQRMAQIIAEQQTKLEEMQDVLEKKGNAA